MKNSFEELNKLSANQDEKLEKIIADSLSIQLQKMTEGIRKERNDAKYIILRDFIQSLKNSSFQQAFDRLDEFQKHVIITRLENEMEHMGGSMPYEFAYKLSKKLYGTVKDEFGEMINLKKKDELEKSLQNKINE